MQCDADDGLQAQQILKQTDTKQLKKGADKTFTDNLIKKNRRQVCTNTEKEWD